MWLFIGLIAHEVRELTQSLPEQCAQRVGYIVLSHRALHAPEPFVAFARADSERHVSRAQARMAVTFDVELRTTGPAGQIQE